MGEDLRVVKTKQNIESQFLRLMEMSDFKDITVRQLIDACRINRSTFYRNYADKYDLAEKIVDTQVAQFKKVLNTDFICPELRKEEQLGSFFMPMMEYFEENRKILLLLYRKSLPLSVFDRMLSVYSEELLQRVVRQYNVPQRQLKIAAYFSRVIADNILTAMKWWHLENPEMRKDEMLDIITRTVNTGALSSLQALFS